MNECPLCNGFIELSVICPHCLNKMENQGRVSDLYGPYSPYRPIDELRMSNNMNEDENEQQCAHYFSCPDCGYVHVKTAQE